MKKDKLSNYTRGWFLGKFEPSLAYTDYEVGLRWNQKGDAEPRHFHKETTEYVAFAGGKHRLGDEIFTDGEMCTIRPYMSTDYECLEPGYCLTVKSVSKPKDKYLGSPVTLAIPMAGKGQRFIDAGYKTPKPFIKVLGVPMINRVIENFTPDAAHRFILVTREGVNPRVKNGQVVQLDFETQGAVSTMFEVEHLIGRDDPLLIANCDQLISGFDVDDFMNKSADCSVTTFTCDNPHHSYVKEVKGLVTEVAEKKVISNTAVSGVYFYRKAKYYFDAAHRMVEKDIRVNGEFYNSPVFNEIIADGLKVNTYHIDGKRQHILGTPQELKDFYKKLKSGKVVL